MNRKNKILLLIVVIVLTTLLSVVCVISGEGIVGMAFGGVLCIGLDTLTDFLFSSKKE